MSDGLEIGADELLDLPLRVWAELGRTRLPAARIVQMAPGTVVDLDREPEDLADIYVNGRHFGQGALVLVDGEWAVKIASIDHDEVEQMSSGGSAD